MDRLAQLEAIEEIRAVKARYFRAMDMKAWDELAAVFTADMQVVTPDGAVWLEGGPAYATSLRRSLEHAVSQHQGFTHEIELTGPDEARGIWAMQDVIHWPDPHRHPREGWKAILGRGHYHDRFRREEGGWRIAALTLTRISLDITR